MQRILSGTVTQEKQQEFSISRPTRDGSLKQEQFLLETSAVQLALFGPLAWWVHFHPVLPIDLAITRTLQRNQSPFLRYAMIVVSFFNEHSLLNVLAIPTGLILWKMHLRLEAMMIVGATLTSNLLRVVTHHIVNRPRPSPELVRVQKQSHSKSFPSGHVLGSVTFWGWVLTLLMLLSKGKRWWQKVMMGILVLFIVLVGPSRVYQGEHWASDVIGGYLLGGSWLGLTLLLYLRLRRREYRSWRDKDDSLKHLLETHS